MTYFGDEAPFDDNEFDGDLNGCPFGFEFCSEPQTKDMELCTTECSDYFNAIEGECVLNTQEKEGSTE